MCIRYAGAKLLFELWIRREARIIYTFHQQLEEQEEEKKKERTHYLGVILGLL